ncbi:V-snare-domain-containing protein [Rhodotorula sp. JG-1b]|nr:V-snare-domain-containing protein [Rhodotorula sp. JG-1b]
MAADAFQGYQREYLALRSSVQGKLDSQIPVLKGEERKAAIRRVNMELDEVDEIIDQLEHEGKGKAKLMAQVRAYRQEAKSWKAKATSLGTVTDRDLLLSSRPTHSSYPVEDENDDDDVDTFSHSAAQRARLLQSTQTLDTSSQRLENSHRLALENEQIGQEVLGSLVGQRMQLQSANEHLEEADVSIGRASGTIKKMVRLAYRQRIVISAFVLAFAVLIALILWRKLR